MCYDIVRASGQRCIGTPERPDFGLHSPLFFCKMTRGCFGPGIHGPTNVRYRDTNGISTGGSLPFQGGFFFIDRLRKTGKPCISEH